MLCIMIMSYPVARRRVVYLIKTEDEKKSVRIYKGDNRRQEGGKE